MRTACVLLGFGLLAIAATGCGPSAAGPTGGATPALPAPQSTANWKQVDNLDYLNWKKFPVGTVVVRTAVSTNGEGSTTGVDTFTLKAVGDAEVSVERQNTTSRSDGYHKVNPVDTRKVSAKITVHPELDPTDFLKPDRKAKETGKEKVKVLDAEYECVKWEWTNGTEAGPMSVAAWLSDEVPGRIAKQVMKVKVEGRENVTTETVTEWRKAK